MRDLDDDGGPGCRIIYEEGATSFTFWLSIRLRRRMRLIRAKTGAAWSALLRKAAEEICDEFEAEERGDGEMAAAGRRSRGHGQGLRSNRSRNRRRRPNRTAARPTTRTSPAWC